jgi:O-antigen/teichoic acid export membrane protein
MLLFSPYFQPFSPLIKKNLLYNSLLSVSQILFPLILFPYTFRILEPRGIGLISFAESLTQYLISFAAIGIPIYGIIETAKVRHDKAKLERFFAEMVLIQLLITCFILVFFICCIFYIPKLAENKWLYFISCGILFLNTFTVEWFFQGIEQFRYITLRTILIRMLFVVGVFLFVRKKEDVLLYYCLTFVVALLNSLINFTYANRVVRFHFVGLALKRHLKPLVYIFLSNVAVSVYILLDTVILGFLANDEAVGYYSTSIKISKIPLAFVNALSMALIPRISASFSSGDHAYVQNLVQKSFAYVVILSVPIGVGLLCLAPEVIQLLANDKFAPAIPVIRVLSPLTLVIGLSGIFGTQMLISMGKERLTLIAVTMGMILSVVGNLVLIPVFSFMGTAYTTLLAEGLVTIVTGWYAIRFFHVKLPFKILWQSLAACILFYPTFYLIRMHFVNPFVKLMLMGSIAGGLYFGIQYFLFRNRYMKETIEELLSKMRYGKI